MPAIDRGLDSLSFLSDALREALRRRLHELGGLALIVLAMLLAVALATWSVQDPSLSHATNAPVGNLLGLPGAIVADLLMQLLGIAALALVLPVAIWGWRLTTHRPLRRERIRLGVWIVGVLLAAVLAACLPRTSSWPLPAGLGGVTGDGMLRLAVLVAGDAFIGPIRVVIGAAAGVGALLAFAVASGFGWHERPAEAEDQDRTPIEDDEDRGSVSPGWIVHGLISIKSRRARLNARRGSASPDRARLSEEAIEEIAPALESVLGDFGVRGEIINARPGPVVTLYELEPAPGIKSSRVIGLADDIARSMSALSARVAVVAGRNVIGIELPNPRREKVFLRELLESEEHVMTGAALPLCLGKTIGGESVIADLARMPHLLIAGTTGSGKSVAINTMILSLVYRLRPEHCRLIMVDPKMLELSVYDGIPHLLTPVVTDPKKAVVALKWAVREMEERYKKISKLGVRNVEGFNARLAEARVKGEKLSRTVHTGYDRESGEAIYEHEELDLEPLPLIVVIVDEMADLMMVAGKDIEGAVQRLAQMARAAGLHVILATQRPSVDVITGTIKANFPTRISFQVTSKIDSRTILGEQGAEQLLGQGDMLYM